MQDTVPRDSHRSRRRIMEQALQRVQGVPSDVLRYGRSTHGTRCEWWHKRSLPSISALALAPAPWTA